MKKSSALQLEVSIFLATFIFCNNSLNAQLIPHGDFENVGAYTEVINGHPNTTLWNASTMFPSPWLQPTDGTCDVFTDHANFNNYSACYDPNFPTGNGCFPQVCPTDNKFGCETRRSHPSGYNYVYMGFTAAGTNVNYSPTDFREYLQVAVTPTNGLTKGQCYVLDFYVSLSDLSQKCTPIQAYISPTAPTHHGSFAGVLPTNIANSQLLTSKLIDQKTGWYHVFLPFTAFGGEKYITIGFFEDETSAKIKPSLSAANCSSTSCGGAINGAYYYIDDVNLSPSAGSFTPSLSYSGTNVSGTWTNANVLLNGTITVNGNLTMNGCTVKCTNGTKIIVPSGNYLQINGTTITAGCDHMWDGIVVQYGGVIYMDQLSSVKSDIEDALTAVDLDGGMYYIQNSTFKRNVIDIHFNYNTITPGHYIKAVNFDHTQTLKDPSLTSSGKGLGGVSVTALSGTSNALLIGGTSTSELCTFIGGNYGVQSSDANVTMEHCTIYNTTDVAVDFQGNNSTTFKTLTVSNGCYFHDNKRHILSQHRTNLTVQGSVFVGSQQHSIDWEDNHDGHLLIGDASNSANGNTFYNNSWTCVMAWDNATATAPSNTAIATNTTNAYTSIVISHNLVQAAWASEGFAIGEWSLGSNVPYHTLEITYNTMYLVTKGIQLYNIRGWGGAFTPNNTPSTLPPQLLYANMINTSTAQASNAFGMKVENATGFTVQENGVSSDNTGNYMNKGIDFVDAGNSEIKGNIISAGTAIACGLDMLGSNIHCNTLANYAVGIYLGYEYLRPQNTLHGSASEEYNNSYNSGVPWNADIYAYSTDKDKNQWVWNGANSFLAIDYNSCTGAQSSIISTTTGTDHCSGPFGITYVSNDTSIHVIIAGDANAQWRSDYEYEVERMNTGKGDSTIASANIKAIIRIENFIASQQYGQAKSSLSSLSPTCDIETNYKTVLTIFANLKAPVQRDARTGEIDTLTSIAEQFQRTGGAAVSLARAYLALKYHIYFKDELPTTNSVTGMATISSPCSLAPSAKTELGFMSDKGDDLPIFGTTIDANGEFNFDPLQLAYYSSLHPSVLYRIYAKYGSQYTVVNSDFHTLADWIAASPISISLSGVAMSLDTVTTSPYQAIDNYTTMDGGKNHYSIGVVDGGTTKNDFLIEKRDGDDNLIWSRTYSGPVAGDDSATCLFVGSDEMVYVAGKIWNGFSYDWQLLKYDQDGMIQWTSTLSDSAKRNNTPTGISVDENDGSISVTGTCMDGSTTYYRFAQYWQCLPSSARLAHASPEMATPEPSITFYPNPSTGNITVMLNGQTGGTLELFNMEGQLVFNQRVYQSGEVQFPEKQVPEGMYILKITENTCVNFNKLLIKRNN